MTPSESKFVCDDHCGRLARWLRFLGFDCAHRQDFDDATVLRIALDEARTILTRDHTLAEKAMARSIVLLDSADPLDQVRQVVGAFGLRVSSDGIGTVCTVCNLITDSIEKDVIEKRLPPYVRATQQEFRECPQCHRLYWRATHVMRMLERLRNAGILP